MADVKWIKIVTDMFNHRKIKQIESMPDCDAVLVIWVKLLCLAGSINENGAIIFTGEVPYTDEMLAQEFGRPVNTIRMALAIFEKYEMIEIVDNIYCISNWKKYQSTEKLEQIREKTRQRVAKYRENKRIPEQISEKQDDVTLHVTQCNAIELDKELDINTCQKKICYEQYAEKWNSLYPLFAKITKLTPKRQALIKARLKEGYSQEDIFAVFDRASASSFLLGNGGTGWKADFDWVLKADRFVEIVEGKWDNRETGHPTKGREPVERDYDKVFTVEG
jgi:predicted phage replisome organizer